MNVLHSRKFWTTIIGLASIGLALVSGEIGGREAIIAVVPLLLGYMGLTAWEDNAKRAVEFATLELIDDDDAGDSYIEAE